MSEKYLAYRGDIQAAAGQGNSVVFTTVHKEDQPTALYRLNAEQLTIEAESLPCGGQTLLVADDVVFIAGTDAQLYARTAKDKKPKPLGKALPGVATTLAALSEDRLAAAVESQVLIVSRQDAKILQTLEIPEKATAITADPTGEWLVVGTMKGNVLVFECEEKKEFLLSESEKLHDGAVTALLFEPEELRFFSAGLDQKLLITHARGKLEPEDRGRGASHEDRVTAMLLSEEDRFFTGGRDSTVKAWTRGGAQRPSTQDKGIAKVAALARVEIHNRPHLAVACEDNSFRFFLIDPSGKLGQQVHNVYDAYDSAEYELQQNDITRRQAALKTLAGYADARSLELVAATVNGDSDHGVRLLATELIGESKHPSAVNHLEALLSHSDSAVRLAALSGLRASLGEKDRRPLELALAARKADVGRQAIDALEQLAKKDDQAAALLQSALDMEPREVRQAALLALENIFAKDSPEAELKGQTSRFVDIRTMALVRLMQRGLVDQAEVQSALRRASEDKDPGVRRTAFMVSLFTRPNLVTALRARDAEIHRVLFELESSSFAEEIDADKESEKKGSKKDQKENQKDKDNKLPAQPKATKLDLEQSDYEPLLQAMASRSLDTCLLGGQCLATLGDARAFGLLLQLSREDSAAARVEVCQSLANLGDPRSAERLATLLNDDDAAVRDAAFTALTKIYDKQALRAAELGLSAQHEDVNKRGLQLLIKDVRKRPPKSDADPSWDLLRRALNDAYQGVRNEALKACLNTNVAGGGADTLRFVLGSVHEDIRREALTETMGQISASWAPALLLEFLNDPSGELRSEAFEFAGKKAKGKDIAHLEAATASKYPDTRLLAIAELAKKKTAAAQELLGTAVNDDDLQVRQAALNAVLTAGGEAVVAALSNQHVDVRLKAATARAWHGDPRALKPLMDLVTEPEPTGEEKVKTEVWRTVVEQALKGLEILADPNTFDAVLPITQSKHASLRQAAASALTTIAREEHQQALTELLQHDDPEVKYRAALALAWCEDETATPIVFSADARKVLEVQDQLAAAVTLEAAAEDALISTLDSDDVPLRRMVAIILLLREIGTHDGVPRRCLALVSAKPPRLRMAGAKTLRAFGNTDALLAIVQDTLNDRDLDPDWKIPVETVQALAAVFCFAPAYIKHRSVHLLAQLREKEQAGWDLHWSIFAERYATEIADAQKAAADNPPPASEFTPEHLAELAFGAYIGLLREQPAYEGNNHRRAAEVAKVRQTAIRRLVEMAGESDTYKSAAISVFIQALGDPNRDVRTLAFESLQTLNVDPTRLGSEALQCGQLDLGIAGLKLLTEGASAKQGQEILRQAMLTREDGLAIEAAELLKESQGVAKIAAEATGARYASLRLRSLNWLAAAYEEDKAAAKALQAALESRFAEVRRSAAELLAAKKDPAAFDALVEQLQDSDSGIQRKAIAALLTLGDKRTPAVLLDRLENDPRGTAEAAQLIHVAGVFRQTDVADRLLTLSEKDAWRDAAFGAVLTISGFDQEIEDPDDDLPTSKWEEKQHPRHVDILAKLFEKTLELGRTNTAMGLIESVRWAKGSEVDAPLVIAAGHSDDNLRHQAVQAVGWRFKHRGGSADPLVSALSNKDGDTRFLAAEGLARGGRDDGISVLQAAVELMTEFDLRERAVSALGELADPRALDLLLKLAGDSEHALQDVAAEAIGRLGKSDKAEEIFALLKRLALSDGYVRMNAMIGLRWFDSPEAWQLLRSRAEDPTCSDREVALEQLGYNDTPETRDLLLRALAKEDEYLSLSEALKSARRIFGSDSLEPDYAWLKNSNADDGFVEPEIGNCLQRVCARGEPEKLLELVPFCQEDDQLQLLVALTRRAPLDDTALEASLSSNRPKTVEFAARLLLRSEGNIIKKSLTKAVEAALEKWLSKWDEHRQEFASGDLEMLREELVDCLKALAWAGGRAKVAAPTLVQLLTIFTGDTFFGPVRQRATLAMGEFASADVTEALEQALTAENQDVRVTAAAVLGNQSAGKLESAVATAVADRQSLQRLLAKTSFPAEVSVAAVSNPDTQGVALPFVVAEQQVDSLVGVMQNAELTEFARLGAIEGLGQIADAAAVEQLATFGATESEDEDLRKAAWRARRRAIRLMANPPDATPASPKTTAKKATQKTTKKSTKKKATRKKKS